MEFLSGCFGSQNQSAENRLRFYLLRGRYLEVFRQPGFGVLEEIDGGFEGAIIKVMGKKNITIDDLAGMVKKGFDGVDQRFNKVDNSLERIEKFIIAEHRRRIEKLETEVKELKELLAVK